MFTQINKWLFPAFFLLFLLSGFGRNDYKAVKEIQPELSSEPLQLKLEKKEPIEFRKNGYAYVLTPLFDYEINALVVHKMNYAWFTVYKGEKIFSDDLCLIWGDNLKSRVYQNKAVQFSQDCRWCMVEWSGNVDFNFAQLSNNHLLINSKNLEQRLKALSCGDQIRLKGKLVNVKARLIGKADNYSPEWFSWNSSVTRSDRGAGACEVIYVEEVELLKKAHPVFYFLYQFSFYGLILLIIVNLCRFFYNFFR